MRAFALLTIIFIILVFSILTVGFVSLIFSGSNILVQEQGYDQAFYIAEAGKSYAAKYLIGFRNWSGDLGMPIAKSFGEGSFIIDTADESAASLTLYSTGAVTKEGKTYARTIKMEVRQTGFPGVYNCSFFFSGGGSNSLEIDETSFNGNIFLGADTEFDDDSSVSDGTIFFLEGIDLEFEDGGDFFTEELSEVPPLPPFDNSYYAGLLSSYDEAWAGGSTSLTISSGTLTLAGETLVRQSVYIRGTAKIEGYGTIAANGNLEVFENAVVEPDEGKTIALVAKDWAKVKDNATIHSGTIIYSERDPAIIHGPGVEVNGALIMSHGKVDIYDRAYVSGESTVYIPADCTGKEYSVFDLEDNSTFNGSIIVETAANKKVRLDDSDLAGLIYIPYSQTEIGDMNIAGTVIVGKLKNNQVNDSTLSSNVNAILTALPQGFATEEASLPTGVAISGWEEVY